MAEESRSSNKEKNYVEESGKEKPRLHKYSGKRRKTSILLHQIDLDNAKEYEYLEEIHD